MIKFFGLIPRRRDISSAEFHDHYRHPHGTVGRLVPTFRGYVQSHQIHSPLLGEEQIRFEAVAEVWFDTVADAVGLADDPHYLEHVQPDEPNFVDLDWLKWLYTTEEVLVSGPSSISTYAERRDRAMLTALCQPTILQTTDWSNSSQGARCSIS